MHHSHFSGQPTRASNVIHWATAYELLFERISRMSDARLIALAGVRPGGTVLDVGCGPGSLTLAAQRAVGSAGAAYGIDPASEMIARAQRKAGRTGLGARFQAGGIEALPFPDAMFDVALGRLMFHHLSDEQKRTGLREVRRVLKPGGLFLTADVDIAPGGLASRLLAHTGAAPMAHVNLGSYAQLYADAGFIDIRTGPTGSAYLSFVVGRKPG